MSSRSDRTRKTRSSAGKGVKTLCPACGRGTVERVIVSKTFQVEGKRIRIDGLMPNKCEVCGELTWSEAELERADQAIAIKLHKAVA